MSVEAVLQSITERSGLSRHEGHPLWAYKVTASELDALERALRVGLNPVAPSPAASGAFCLFAADKFCREHSGGAWKWQPILEPIGWSWGHGSMLYDLVEAGLRYWNCGRVISTQHRSYYQRTLACQGGLPLRLLTSDGNNSLRAYFARLLRTSEAYNQPPAELALTLAQDLPRTLRNDVVYEVASALVSSILELRKRLPGASEDPLGELDRVAPRWRDQVPLRLEEGVAEQLLHGLLREPTPTTTGSGASFLELELQLRQNGSAWLARAARFEPVASEDDFKSLLRLRKEEELPPYFQLSMVAPEGTRLPVANAHRLAGEPRYRISAISPQRRFRRGEGLLGTVRVVASIGTSDIGTGDMLGGQAVPEELPWVLRGGRVLDVVPVRAFGSGRAAGDRMLILLPEDGELTVDGKAGWLDASAPPGRRLVELRGSARWTNADGDVCSFATNAIEEDVPHVLRGQYRRHAFAGSEVWLDAPQVHRVEPNGREREVAAERVEWRPRRGPSSGAWRPWSDRPCGDLSLRARNEEGDTVFRTTITVVPKGLEVSVRNPSSGRGTITITHPAVKGAQIVDKDLELEVVNEPGRSVLHLRAKGATAPTVLRSQVLFEDGLEATLEVPSPLQVRCFVGFDGKPLPAGSFRALDRLGTVRARAFEPRGNALVLEGRRAGTGGWQALGDLDWRDDGVLELSLDRVEAGVASLLAGTDSLDGTVELRLVPRGGMIDRPPEIEVRRYDTELVPIKHEGSTLEVRVPPGSVASLGADGLDRLKIEAVRLDAPDAEPVLFGERSAPDTWRVPADLTAGPWLVLGWQGEWARLRPLLFNVAGDPPGDLDVLQRAVWIGNPDERTAAMLALLEEMESSVSHEAWPRLFSMTRWLKDLTPATFDAVRLLTERPTAAALLMLHPRLPAELRSVVWGGLEELPFLWATVPLRDWMRAARRLLEFAEQPEIAETFGGSQEALRELLGGLVGAAPNLDPFINVVLEVFARSLPGVPAAPVPYLAMIAQARPGLEYFRNELLQRNSSRRWPEPKLDEIVDPRTQAVANRALRVLSHDPTLSHRDAVREAPALAAALAITGEKVSPTALFQLRLLRDFDPEWFRSAHALFLALMANEAIEANPEAFDV
ncbi:MAG: STY4851/ECs_5259 family protein [Sandaracinaceae bacterium]